MGRRRLELRRIEDRASRLVSFSKRRGGLFKKANELAVLCDADVGLVLFSPKGKLYNYSNSSIEEIIQRYRQFSDAEKIMGKGDPQALVFQNCSMPNVSWKLGDRLSRSSTNIDLMEIAQRYQDEANINKLSANELAQVEIELQAALRQTMSNKRNLLMDMITKLQEKGKMLQQERRSLELELALERGQCTGGD